MEEGLALTFACFPPLALIMRKGLTKIKTIVTGSEGSAQSKLSAKVSAKLYPKRHDEEGFSEIDTQQLYTVDDNKKDDIMLQSDVIVQTEGYSLSNIQIK